MHRVTVSRRIEQLRRERLGLTQRELAALLVNGRGERGIQQVTVSRWERAEVEPSLRYLRQLAGLADVPVQWFFEDDEAAA